MPKKGGSPNSSNFDDSSNSIHSPPNNSGTIVKAGYLQKWTNYIKGYRQRWFVLDSNGNFSYYR